MSNPPNPLAKFSTYSYHQVLVITDGMNTVNHIVNNPEAFNRSDSSIERRYDVIPVDGIGGYIILVDSRTDMNFNIQEVEWETILAPRRYANGIRYANTIEAAGTMTIKEPFGVDLLSIMAEATRDLERAPSSLVFILKTLFVGIRPDGGQEIISNIKPFSFVMTDIKAKIDEGGSTYNLEFYSVVNGIGKAPKISQISNGMGITLDDETTIGDALKVLENLINKRYDIYYNNLANSLEGNGLQQLQQQYTRVKYRIEADSAYFNAPYLVGDQASTSDIAADGKIVVKASKHTSVMTMINMIAGLSSQIGKDAKGESPDDRTYTTKITSTLGVGSSNDEQVVIYRLNRYETNLQSSNDETEPQPGEFIEFDYIYADKNVDILNFDIKMDYGLSFFQTIALSKNPESAPTEVLSGEVTEVAAGGGNSQGSGDVTLGTSKTPTNRREPLYLGMNADKADARSKTNPLYDITFDALIQRQAALENINAAITIIGNPQLLSETTPFYNDVINGTGEQRTPDSTGATDWFHVPALMKINIRYPTDDTLTATKPFWYQGYYNLHTIKNKFSGGQFTQDIVMFSIPSDSSVGLNTNAPERTTNESILNGKSSDVINNNRNINPAEPIELMDTDDVQAIIFSTENPSNPDFEAAHILYKSEVNLHPRLMADVIIAVYPTVVAVWNSFVPNIRPVITSTQRNTKVANTNRDSRHKTSEAIDIRGKNLTLAQGRAIRNDLRRRLAGRGYTVLFEIFGTRDSQGRRTGYNQNGTLADRNHIHIQYDGRDLIIADDNEVPNDNRT